MRSEYSCHCDRSHDAESRRYSPSLAGVIASLLLFCLAAMAPVYGQAADSANGKLMDGAYVRQSVEFGGHIVDLTGSSDMYNTLVDQTEGPRLLNQSLSIQTTPGHKALFDSLYLNSFGWGGEANNVMRLRMDKQGTYRFTITFRRNRAFFDYNLLANPLNAAAPVVDMSPQHKLSFVLGLSRIREEGPSFSSVHANRVDAVVYQPYSTAANTYRMGVNWRILPQTTLSFLESLQIVRNFTDQTLTNPLQLLTPLGTRTLTTYDRTQSYDAFIPTEQVSLTSSSIRNLEFTAHVAYSDANANTPLTETYTGTNGVNPVSSNTNGTMAVANWVTNEADFGATYHINPHLRLVDTFRFHAYRVPGYLDLLGSSPGLDSRFVQQSTKSNEFTVQYDVARNFGVRAGYLYRRIFDGHAFYVCDSTYAGPPPDITGCQVPANLDEDEQDNKVTINQHTAIFGAWYRLGRKIRANAEYRLTSADNSFVRVDPRREQRYRANVRFTPIAWLTLGANFNFIEQRNASEDFGYKAHSRNVGFTVLASPNDRLTLEADYQYANTARDANVCYPYGANPPLPGSFACVSGNAAYPEILGGYSAETHFGSANVIFKPVHRVTAALGYSVTRVDGKTLTLNPLQPLGPLSNFYHQPHASLGVQVCKPLELRAAWEYYQYNEYGGTGTTSVFTPSSRYFHANVTTLSALYSF
jgi:hypothetical protein